MSTPASHRSMLAANRKRAQPTSATRVVRRVQSDRRSATASGSRARSDRVTKQQPTPAAPQCTSETESVARVEGRRLPCPCSPALLVAAGRPRSGRVPDLVQRAAANDTGQSALDADVASRCPTQPLCDRLRLSPSRAAIDPDLSSTIRKGRLICGTKAEHLVSLGFQDARYGDATFLVAVGRLL